MINAEILPELSSEPRGITADNKDKRILWLINHTTLREFELPLLIALGYEIYTPKRVPALIYEWSGSIEYGYDSTLSIPEKVLEQLNQHDFYEDPITHPIAATINRYFGTAFCVFYPKMLDQLTRHFDGRILLRAFGLEKNMSYEKAILGILGSDFFLRLCRLEDRFWFSQAYPNLDEVEPDVFKSKSVTHPLGLPDSFFKHQNTWVGGNNQILFFCARIKASPTYYGKIYTTFKQHFGDLPHIIAGRQPIAVDDPAVAGEQPRANIDEWMRTSAVMFYHSQEPRHLHYHPLEALVFGTPLIFMRDGILEKLGGDYQPGACATFKEAREKIKRILDGDAVLIADIRKHQANILECFTFEYNLQIWEKNFVSQVMTTKPKQRAEKNTNLTIGVFLPEAYRGGTLNGAKNIAKMLHLGSRDADEPAKVIFSCVADTYDLNKDFGDLIELGITVRETVWKSRSKAKIKLALQFTGDNFSLSSPRYVVPTDGNNNFNDCDFWLIVSDRIHYPLAPLKPYGIVVYDYIQRYVPEIFPPHFDDSTFLSIARRADFVFTTTPATREDAIQYAGIPSGRAYLTPMEFNPLAADAQAKHMQNSDYFLWATNATQHKNHLCAIKALSIYYSDLGGNLDVVMTGVNTELFDLNKSSASHIAYINEVRQLLGNHPKVKQHLSIKGNLDVSDYVSMLSAAKFLWHPTLIDNGTFSVIEAAYHGVPALSSDYPQMRYINDRFKLDLSFCNGSDAYAMALELKKMEEEHLSLRSTLPDKKFLEQFSYDKIAPEYWGIFRSLL